MKLPFRLCVISDRARMGPDPAETVVTLARAGLRAFQWREKDLTPAENHRHLREIATRLEEAELLRGDPCGSGSGPDSFHLFVNDRADLALALCLHVQLTESSLPTGTVRAILHPGQLVGRSTHSLEGAAAAEAEGADFVTFGPIYDTPSKRAFGPPAGPLRLREVCNSLSIPVMAIGGITLDRIPECMSAGAAACAVIGAVWGAPDPEAAVKELVAAAGREPDSASPVV